MPSDDATLEIGDGDHDGFVPVEGRAVDLVYGPQGGFHILVSLRATGLDADERMIVRLRGRVDDRELADMSPFVTFRCQEGEGLFASRLLVVWNEQPSFLHERLATLVAVLDHDDVVVTAQAEFRLLDPRAAAQEDHAR